MKRELTIIGIVPQYPKHSQQNIYARIKMPPVGLLSVMSQINNHPRLKEIYAIDENNYNGPQDALQSGIDIVVQVRSEVEENDEMIEAMRFAGVSMLAIGYESPINEELRAMRKGVTAEKLIARSKKLSNYFYLHGMFIFGYPVNKNTPQDSFITIKQRAEYYKKFFKRSGIDTIQVLNAVPLPGSELRARF
jgi:radical SAM superfamily enzyme YgiQ (UPF0313 family)